MLNRRAITLALAGLPLLPRASFAAERIRMFELYEQDQSFSAKAKTLQGRPVEIQGFMAPHLKVNSDFFILSNTPVETCPFCATEGDWIDSIVFVRMRKREQAISPGRVINTTGRLEIGPETDSETGFVSRVRLIDAVVRLA
ncbi:MAG TPA: hypothetical protein VIL09_02180 [Microvirga sp.]|jgi:hypothetical protein